MKNKPNWIKRILKIALKSVQWTTLKSPINKTFGYRCFTKNGSWTILFFPWLHEIYGGKYDGGVKLPLYEVNLLDMADEFDKINYIGFDTEKSDTLIKGEIENNKLSIIFSKTPPNKNICKKINAYTGEVTKK